jgi:hypothetical protein
VTSSWSCARKPSPGNVAQNTSGRRSAIDGRTTRHPGYAVSQRIRKRIEEAFGWAKTVASLRKMRHRGLLKVDWQFTLAMAAYDLVRLPKLLGPKIILIRHLLPFVGWGPSPKLVDRLGRAYWRISQEAATAS